MKAIAKWFTRVGIVFHKSQGRHFLGIHKFHTSFTGRNGINSISD